MKIVKKIMIIIFILIILLPAPLSFIFYRSDSSNEKREKSEFPTQLSDDYFSKINDWFNDNSPFRESIIRGYSNIDTKLERNYLNFMNDLIYGKPKEEVDRKDIVTTTIQPTTIETTTITTDVDTTIVANEYPLIEDYDNQLSYPYLDKNKPYYPYSENGNVFYGRDNWLFFNGDCALDFYTGANALENEYMGEVLDSFLKLKQYLDKKGVIFKILILPNKEQVYADKMPTIELVHQAKMLQRLNYYFKSREFDDFVYPLEELIDARANYDTYYMQDTHWNEYGAMIGLNALLKSAGLEGKEFNVTTKKTIGGDLAQLISYDGDEYSNYSVEWKENVSVEVSENSASKTYISSNVSETNAIIIGDSFRGAFVPNLAKCFHSTTSIDIKSNDIEYYYSMIESLKPGEMLIIEGVERFFFNVFNCINSINDCIEIPLE